MQLIAVHDLLKWDKEQIQSLRVIAYLYYRQGTYRRALALSQLLLFLTWEQTDQRQWLYDCKMTGAIYLELGELEAALFYLKEAHASDPNDRHTTMNCAFALLLSGALDEGRAIAQKLAKGKEDAITRRARALLMAYPAKGQQPVPAEGTPVSIVPEKE